MKSLLVGVFVVLALAGGSAAAPSATAVRNGPLVFDGLDPSDRTVQIYRISPSGHGLKQLTHAPPGTSFWSECPSSSANGRKIFFDGNLPSHVYRMSSRGTHRRRIDSPRALPHTCPAASRDGSHLVVVEHTPYGISRIVRMTAKGRSPQVLAQAGNRYQNFFDPHYAPMGNRISFSGVEHNRSGKGYRRADIIVIHHGGGTDITERTKRWFYAPSWAPSGKLLVAIRGNRFGGKEIVTMRPNGRSIRHVARASEAVSSVAFSPDGDKIAYVQCKTMCSPFHQERGASIWIMNADGSGRHAILRQASAGVAPVQRVDWARRGL
jgi:Tol biopolymer transport system component